MAKNLASKYSTKVDERFTRVSQASTNAEAMAFVERRKRYGFEANLHKWQEMVDTGNGTGLLGTIGKNDIALGEFLYTEAVKANDVHAAMRLIAELAAVGTQAGQVVQAMSMLKRIGPSGQLYYLQKAVDRMNTQYEKQIGKGTFQDFSAFAAALSKFERTNTATQLLVGGLMPFKKTPVNILKRGVEYSPIGLAKSLTYDLYKLYTGDKTSAQVIDSFASGFTGTGLLALGVIFAMKGLLRANGDDDEKKNEFEELQGAQNYSFVIGNKNFTIDWMAPAALPLFIGCEVFNAFGKDREFSAADLMDTLMLVSEPMFQMTMLDGLNKTLTSAGYSDNPLTATISSVGMSYLSQFIPTLLGQIARTADSTRRSTYVDKNKDSVETLDRFWQSQVMAKVPGLNNQRTEWIDAWGRTDTEASVIKRFFDNAIWPWYSNEMKTSTMEDERQRLYEVTGNAYVLPRSAAKYFNVNKQRYDLSADEWVKYQTVKGQMSYEMLTSVVNSAAYATLSDAQKAEVVEKIHDYANETARAEAVPAYDGTPSWVSKANELTRKGVSVEDYCVYAVLDNETSGKTTQDIMGMSWLSDNDKASLIAANYGKSLTGGNAFTDPNRSGYEFVMNESQVDQYIGYFEALWSEGYIKLLNSVRYKRSDETARAEMLDKLKSAVATDTKRWMARQLRKAGIRSTKKD